MGYTRDDHVAELEAAIDRVRFLHSQDGPLAPGKWCPACGDDQPCRTIRALNESSDGHEVFDLQDTHSDYPR